MNEIFIVIASLVAAWVLLIGLIVVIRPGGLNLRDAALFVPQCLLLLKRLTSHSLRGGHRIVVLLAVVYLISPVDLVPDFIPIVGAFDDVVVAVAALRYAARNVNRSDIETHWSGSDAGLALILRRNQTS